MQLLTFHKLSYCNLISCPVNHELSLGFALVIPIGRFCKPNERTWLCHFLSSACSCDRWLWPILSLSQAGSARWCFVVPMLGGHCCIYMAKSSKVSNYDILVRGNLLPSSFWHEVRLKFKMCCKSCLTPIHQLLPILAIMLGNLVRSGLLIILSATAILSMTDLSPYVWVAQFYFAAAARSVVWETLLSVDPICQEKIVLFRPTKILRSIPD